MLTHILKSVNWVDVAIILVIVRVVFFAVKNGFVAEFTKVIGTVVAVFISLHYYSLWAAWVIVKTKLVWPYWDLLLFILLWVAVVICFRLIGAGLAFLFKVESNHVGFDKYAAGILAVARSVLVCSLTLFLILLTHYGPLTRMTVHAYSFKYMGRAALLTYNFLYKNFADKLIEGMHYNPSAGTVIGAVHVLPLGLSLNGRFSKEK